MRIGFLGPKGTFSHEALEIYAKKIVGGCESVEFGTIPDMLHVADSGAIDEAVVPIENSLEGAVNVTLDMLAGELNLKIKSEIILSIRQNLIAKKGTLKKDIKTILSHPQALGQCRHYLAKEFPHVETRYVYSTAGGAEEIASNGADVAAIGSRKAAEQFGLDILESDIQDDSSNCTRFVVLSREDSPRTGCDKTSIVFSTEDKPGSLYRILDIFNLWEINMTRIESRPARNELGRYIFFVDLSGHRDDCDVEDALKMVRRRTSFYKFLGSYGACKDKY